MVFDGLSFFRDYNIRYTTTGTNVSEGWVGLKCPFCGDHSDHMGLLLSVGAFSCWRCGKKGTVATISRLLGVPKSDATRIYAEYLVNRLVHSSFDRSRKKASATQVILPGSDFTKLELKYLKERMLLSRAEQYNLRSGGISGDWAFRIVIPIKLNGMIISATGRYIIDEEGVLRYKTLSHEHEVVHHKHTFLAIDDVPSDTIVVLEGPIDAMRGGPGFVSGFGITLMEEQIAILSRYSHVIFMFDNEDQAQKQAHRYAEDLAMISKADIEVIRLDGPYKDLGEMPEDAIADVRKELGII